MTRALEKKHLIENKKFQSACNCLYQDIDYQAERYSKLTENLNGKIFLFSSPGRTELIGNHTDHNNGYVLASTVDLDTAAAVIKKQDSNEIIINSFGYSPVVVKLNDLEIRKEEYGTSDALVRGVIKGFIDRNLNVGGFIANTHSNIFKGAGVSSSAAFELLVCEILNVFYNENKIDYITKAIISQYAENEYFGKPSGLMDQLTISRGGVSFMDFENTLLPNSETINWNFDNLSLVIINCGGDHCNLTDEYSQIKSDMKKVSDFFNKSCLRQVEEKEFFFRMPSLLKKCGGRSILRAKHFFDENNRVKKAIKALEEKNQNSFVDLINASGCSSYEQLQNCYPKNDEQQFLALGIHLAKMYEKTKAVRVHGGGFAGTILAILDKKDTNNFTEYMAPVFGKENIFILSIRKKGTINLEV